MHYTRALIGSKYPECVCLNDMTDVRLDSSTGQSLWHFRHALNNAEEKMKQWLQLHVLHCLRTSQGKIRYSSSFDSETILNAFINLHDSYNYSFESEAALKMKRWSSQISVGLHKNKKSPLLKQFIVWLSVLFVIT